METENLSIIGLTIQCAGIFLITVLSFFMTRSIRRRFLGYWTAAWICLSVALLSLAIGFRVASMHKLYYSIYFFGEYAFGLLFAYGCRNYASEERLEWRHLYWLIPALVLALALSHLSDDFNIPFIPHAAILAGLFARAFYWLQPARDKNQHSPGLRVMSVALVLLALDFLHYVPILSYLKITGETMPVGYLQYTSVYDLILELFLGFGTLMLVMDNARQEVEAANRELIAARDRLEVLVRIDPLTEALNRHAFYSLLEKQGCATKKAPGCVVVLDIDNLKPINDSLGHAAGDMAIREVARSVRSVIRADDLLFRWGGDEFLIIFFNISETTARERISRMDLSPALTPLPGTSALVPVIVSYGLASFTAMSEIDQAIERADSRMYARKQSRKSKEPQTV